MVHINLYIKKEELKYNNTYIIVRDHVTKIHRSFDRRI